MSVEITLNNLFSKIHALLQSHERLQAENNSLRHDIMKLKQERDNLIIKNQQAAIKINNIIMQLRKQLS